MCSSTYAKDHRTYYKDAMTLKKFGNKVTIIAPYEKALEIENDIKIIGLRVKKGYFNRILNNFSLLKRAFLEKADVYYAQDIDALAISLVLKCFYKGKIIYLCREYYPEKQAYRRGKNSKFIGKIFYYIIKTYERIFYPFADAIICVNTHMARKFENLHKNIFVIPNYPSVNFMKKKSNCSVKLPEKTIIYIGGLNEERNIKKLVKIISIIKKKYNYNANLAIFGKGDKRYIKDVCLFAQSLNVSNNLIVGKVSHDEVFTLLSQAEIGIFLPKIDHPAHQWGEPVKFFEYAAAGLPVIMSDLPAKRRLVEIFKNGYVVDPNDDFLIAEKCIELLNNPEKARKMGESGRKCFLRKYNWEANEAEMIRLLEFVKKR